MTDSLLNSKGHVRGLVVVLLIVVALAGAAAWWWPGFWRIGFDHADWTRQARKLAIEVTSTVEGEWHLTEGVYHNEPVYPLLPSTITENVQPGYVRAQLDDRDDPGRDLQLAVDRLVELGFPINCYSPPSRSYPFGVFRLHAGDNLTGIRVYVEEGGTVTLYIGYAGGGIDRPPLVCVR